jgi:hypothetical protein
MHPRQCFVRTPVRLAHVLVLFALIAICAASHAHALCNIRNARNVESEHPSIGVYFDERGTQCEGSIGPGEVGKIYIVAKFGPETDGMAGADFRFAGVPQSWQVSPVPNPEILALGNPLGDGVAIGFPCPPQETRQYVLYEVLVLAGDVQEDVVFSIESRIKNDRRNPDTGGCPLFLSCDAPYFSQTCVETVPCFVNATKTTPCETAVGVAQATWGAVKQLFR